MFRTSTLPEVGYPEEVIWKRDVVLQRPKVVTFAKGRSMISGSLDDGQVYYEVPSWCSETMVGRVARRWLTTTSAGCS